LGARSRFPAHETGIPKKSFSPFSIPTQLSLLSAHNLNVSLAEKPVLKSLDFSIAPGTWVGVLGPNGSGKTTLLRTLGGLLPYSGSLTLHDREIRDWKPQDLAREMAFVRQSSSLSFDFSAGEMVMLGRSVLRGFWDLTTAEDEACVRQALSQVDLAGFEERSMLSLSGGEQQRVMLAQALAQGAGMLLLDEPTAHLDVHHQFEFVEHVRALVSAGRTVVAAFHDLELAARYADALIVLSDGRQIASGSPAHVLSESLIASVFRMQATLHTSEDGALRIHYRASAATANAT